MTHRATVPVTKIEDDCYDWYQRHQEKCAAVAAKKYPLIFIGDSITHFWQHGAVSHGEHTWEEFFDDEVTLNLGFGFDRTQNVLWRLQNGEFANQSPSAIVLNIGTNNLGGSARCPADTPDDTAMAIMHVVKELHTLAPQAEITLCAIFPRGNGEEPLSHAVRQTNALLAAQSSDMSYCNFLDLTADFRNELGGMDTQYSQDLCHPNGRGYRIWGNALRRNPAIARLMLR